jgi:hypothetical protein
MRGVIEGIASVHDYCFFVPAVIMVALVEFRGAAPPAATADRYEDPLTHP